MTPGGEDRETLRRRLYRPGASADDVAAYADGEEAREPEGPPAPERTARPRLLLPALALLAAVAVAGAVVLTGPSPADPPRASPTPAAVDRAPAVETIVRTAGAERSGFIRSLVAADEAGIGLWLDRHARRLPGVLAQAARSDTLEFAGSGSRTLLLDPPSIGEDGGHVTVLVVTAVDARVTWTLLGDAPDLGRGAVTGTRTAAQLAGSLTSAAVDWAPGRRPGTLLVVAPDGVRWGVAAVFSA